MYKLNFFLLVFIPILFALLIFSPFAKSATDPVIVAAGDISCGAGSGGAACKQMETSNLAISAAPAAVLLLGDNQYEMGSLSDFQNFYNPSWGRLKSITYPAVGNHEYLTPNASGYFDYFNGVGNASGAAGDRSKGYYAYNIGSWRLYALNSQLCGGASGSGCNRGTAQETWLRQDLAANPTKCQLAYFHHPLWTSGSRDTASTRPLYQTMYEYKVDVILSGHEHNYERFAPMDGNGNAVADGIREYVVGTGGRNFTAFTHNQANSQVKNDNTFGILKMTLHPTSYDAQFVPIAGSSFTDQLLNHPCAGAGGPAPTSTPLRTPTPVGSSIPRTGDVNRDGVVDIIDIGILVDNYNRIQPTNPNADINHDGVVNIIDIGIIIDNYGR
jgi:acid phosphatase type 7